MACHCRRFRRSRRNPTTPAGYHLRRGMVVLWEDERGQFLLARISDALAGQDDRGVPAAAVVFPNGQVLVAPIDRLHELPRHESTARRRGRW